jgi:hypothetical protein
MWLIGAIDRRYQSNAGIISPHVQVKVTHIREAGHLVSSGVSCEEKIQQIVYKNRVVPRKPKPDHRLPLWYPSCRQGLSPAVSR